MLLIRVITLTKIIKLNHLNEIKDYIEKKLRIT